VSLDPTPSPVDPDAALWALAEGTAGLTGHAFLNATVERLATLLDVAFVSIARAEAWPATKTTVLACWYEGRLRGSFPYDLADTPCAVTLTGRVHFVPNNLLDLYPLARESRAESYLGIPLRDTDGSILGHMAVFDTRPMSACDRRLAVIRIFAMRAEAELRRLTLERQLLKLATTDTLTGVANRRWFLDKAAREVERAHRYALPLSLLALDLDRFKAINDTHGHATGDDVLRAVTACTQRLLRQTDVFGRLGGEEFAILLPHTDADGAIATADRIHAAVRMLCIPVRGTALRITTSIGAAVLDPHDIGVEQLLHRADEALYEAKRAGRNRTILADAPVRPAARPGPVTPAAMGVSALPRA